VQASATVREACTPKGASWLWNHGRGTRTGRAQAPFDAAELSDLVFLRVRGCEAPWIGGRSGCRKASRPPRPKGLREQEPQERQRTQRVRKAGERANRRGGEKPRGRTVPGEANPEHTDLSADAVEGARNPRRGDSARHGRGGRFGPNPERETKSVGAAGRSLDRTDG